MSDEQRASPDDDSMDRAGVADVSVVVPTRNRARLLDRLLRQLVALDGGGLRYEIVVVDEGSSDTTPQLLEGYAASHGVLVLRHDVPRGVSGARNAGTAASSAPFVAWIDDDDLTAPDRLARQREGMLATGARWSCTGNVDIGDELEVLGHARCTAEDGLLTSLLRRNTLPACGQALLVDRSLLEQVGRFDETLTNAEDWDLVIRLAASGIPYLIDEPLVGYRVAPESLSSDSDRMESGIRRVVAKHRALYDTVGTSPDWGAIQQSLMVDDLSAGRARSLARAVKAFRAGPSVGSARRCVLVALSPRWYADRSRRRRRAQVPPAWVAQARGWLDRSATADDAPVPAVPLANSSETE